MPQSQQKQLRVFSKEEIDLFLASDPKVVSGLVLQSLNDLSSALIPHMEKLDEMAEMQGQPDAVRARVEWTTVQMARQQARTKMMQKVSESAIAWAVIAFVGWLVYAGWDSIVAAIKAHK